MRTTKVGLAVLCGLGVLCGAAFAQFQMPDPKQMAGIPRPVDDLPAGSVSVRLIRGQLSNNIASHPVELHFANGRVLTVNTDDAGRAQFDKLPAGSPIKAVAVVDGERLESQEFPAPAQGGIRLMLVATDKSAGAPPAARPAVSGQVTLGDNTRIILEPGDDSVELYYVLEVVNNGTAPVNPTTPFVFDMPKGALSTTILDGSSALARNKGLHVSLAGPIPPGRTMVQVVCQMPADTGSLEISQTFPASLDRVAVLVKKVGDTKLVSPQVERQQDFPSEGGVIIGGMGGALTAGQPLSLSLTDLPHHSPAPRWTALGLAGTVVLLGVWAASRPQDRTHADAERKRLVARREKLFGELVRLEQDRRTGRGDAARSTARRDELIASLEHIYGALDDPDSRPDATA